MAYTPTLADLPPEDTGYTPSLADLPEEKEPTLFDLVNSFQKNFNLGALGSVRNFGQNIADLPSMIAPKIFPKGELPQVPEAHGLAGEMGDMVGNTAAFMGGGSALNALRAGAEGLPLVGKAAQFLGKEGVPGALRRGLGTAAYSALESPQDRLKGAAEGMGLSLALDAIPGGLKLGGKALGAFRPQKEGEAILDMIGGGQTLQDNAKSLATKIKEAYQSQKEKGNELYNRVFGTLGDNPLFESAEQKLKSSYGSIGKDVLENYDRDLAKLHGAFSENPTLRRAHELQSQLGFMSRELQRADKKRGLTIAERKIKQDFDSARRAVRSDLTDYLKNQSIAGKDYLNLYKQAESHWASNVIPYVENSKIAPLAKGEITNPRNLTNIFKNPEEETLKILEDIGAPAKNNIIFNELGRYAAKNNPDSLLKNYERLDEKGLGTYISPKLQEGMERLASKIQKRNVAQPALGAMGGLAAAHFLPMNVPASEVMGAILGAGITPFAANYARTLKDKKSLELLSKLIKKSSPLISKGLKANLLSDGDLMSYMPWGGDNANR